MSTCKCRRKWEGGGGHSRLLKIDKKGLNNRGCFSLLISSIF